MTGFLLTQERRDELAGLLGDEKRFRTTYPVVADYLDTAPRLSGTGNADVDHAFDIRLLHFMAGGESTNPYWDIVGPSVGAAAAGDGRREVNGGDPTGSVRLAFAQTVLQEAFAYAVPAPETLKWVAAMAAGRGVLELGAGRGYWASQLRRIGLDVLAFDSEPPDQQANASFRDSPGQQSVWGHVGNLAELAEARQSGEELRRLLFLCWPPGWGNRMSIDALDSYERAGGDRLIYIGEPRGGKTGVDDFFDKLEAAWELVDEDAQFVTWWNLHDRAQCWSRRT